MNKESKEIQEFASLDNPNFFLIGVIILAFILFLSFGAYFCL